MNFVFTICNWALALIIIILFVVLLLLFGGRRIPELMSGFGKGIKENLKKQLKKREKEESKRPILIRIHFLSFSDLIIIAL